MQNSTLVNYNTHYVTLSSRKLNRNWFSSGKTVFCWVVRRISWQLEPETRFPHCDWYCIHKESRSCQKVAGKCYEIRYQVSRKSNTSWCINHGLYKFLDKRIENAFKNRDRPLKTYLLQLWERTAPWVCGVWTSFAPSTSFSLTGCLKIVLTKISMQRSIKWQNDAIEFLNFSVETGGEKLDFKPFTVDHNFDFPFSNTVRKTVIKVWFQILCMWSTQ